MPGMAENASRSIKNLWTSGETSVTPRPPAASAEHHKGIRFIVL